MSKSIVALLIAAVALVAAPARASDGGAVTGITESYRELTLSAAVPGIIAAEKFREGDAVQAGDVVIELDKKLEELEVSRRKFIVDNRKTDFEGTQKLFTGTKGTSKEELDKKETDYRVAVVEHETAVEQLRRRHIFAPISGQITDVLLHTGEACQPYQPVIKMVDTRQCFFVANVEARIAAGLKLGDEIKLALDTGAAPAELSGRITFLSPVADPASGLVKVKVLFSNPEGKIRPGLAGKLITQ